MHPVLIAATLITATCAAYFDIKRRRIFNVLTLGAAGLALVARLITGGPTGLVIGAEGWLLGLGVLLIPFALGVMGGGDVKLLAAFGALGGPAFLEQAAVAGCLIGGLVAIVFLAYRRRLWFTIKHFIILIQHPLMRGHAKADALPFGAALSAGAVAALFLTGTLA